MAEKDKRYYWLKLKRDFFKRHDIQIIENMPNGKDYILFYLKLLCESVDHDGNLRFSEEIPYNEEMLATITNTNIDIVRSAVKIFTQLHMMEVMDDGTFFMREVSKMLGTETYWAQKKREQKERLLIEMQGVGNFPIESNENPTSPSKSKRKIKSIDIDKDKKNTMPAKADIESFFESIWKLYPNKKGKGQVSAAKRKALYEIGFDEIKRAVERYLKELEKDASWRKPQNGSTFFNSGYIDYLNANYSSAENAQPAEDEPDSDEYILNTLYGGQS